MSIAKMMAQAGRKAVSAVRTGFRAVLSALVTDAPVQRVQAKALYGETLRDVELFQQFGFTSGPPDDTELILVPLGGKSSHSVIVATENGAFRVRVKQGETSVYNKWGAHITLKGERLIHMECDDFVADVKNGWTVNCRTEKVTCTTSQTTATTIKQTASGQADYTAPALTFGGAGGGAPAEARMNANITQTGSITSSGTHTAADHIAQGKRFVSHTHKGDSGGETGPPQ